MGEILSQITRIDNNIRNALAKVAAKGVTVPTDAGSDDLPGLIEQISQAEDLDSVLDTQEAKLTALLSSLDGKAAGGGSGGGSVETCDVTVSVAFGAAKEIYFINANGEVSEQFGGITYNTFTGTVRKGSAICVAATGNLANYIFSCSNPSNVIKQYQDTAYLVVNESDTFTLTHN